MQRSAGTHEVEMGVVHSKSEASEAHEQNKSLSTNDDKSQPSNEVEKPNHASSSSCGEFEPKLIQDRR